MKNTILFILISVFLFIVNCVKKINQPTVETIDGIQYVHNSETPMYPKMTVTFEEELTIGEEDETGEIILYQPSRVVVDDEENIYISDRSDQAIKVFDKRGQYLKTIGAQGGGPGEFKSIGNMDVLPDGRLFVMDYRSRRASIFDSEGEFLTSFNFRNYILAVYLTTDTSFTANENVYGEERKYSIKTFDIGTKELLSYGEFTPPGFSAVDMGGGRMMSISLPYAPHSVFVGDPRGVD